MNQPCIVVERRANGKLVKTRELPADRTASPQIDNWGIALTLSEHFVLWRKACAANLRVERLTEGLRYTPETAF